MRKGLLIVLLVVACLTFVSAQTVRQGSLVPTGRGSTIGSFR
jgi:hypothetical protein